MRSLVPVSSLAAAAALSLGSCASTSYEPSVLAIAHESQDFDTYRIDRVGLMPFEGSELDRDQAEALQLNFFAEMGRTADFELVLLELADLEEVHESEPYRRGWYSPRTIIDIARRYSLDAILFGTVAQQQYYPPQTLSLQVDMVAAETGLVVWSSSVHLSGEDPEVQEGLQEYYGTPREGMSGQDWRLSLSSPRRFSRFAAWQIASTL